MEKKRIQKYVNMIESLKIDPTHYEKFSVKRGLRHADGTGVLVGLTEIGDVHGYIIDENERLPVPGRLRYRGISVKDLVKGFQNDRRFGYEETVFLLLFGQLPDKTELENFQRVLGRERILPDHFTEDVILKGASSDIMNKLARSALSCYSWDEAPEDRTIENRLRQCVELIARFPVFVSYGYHAMRHYYHNDSLFIHAPDPEKSTAENLLLLTRPNKKYSQLEAELLDLCLVLHAEHGGGNNSAFALHVVTSSDTDTYSAVAAAVGALKGAKHGGANNKVMGMMEDIKNGVSNWEDDNEIYDYLAKILKGDAGDGSGLIYGIGHAVYTVSDPRAVLLKRKAEELANATDQLQEFKLYTRIEELAPKAFKEIKQNDKVVCANVDFYSGFVYRMLGIPSDLYTPIFAVARIAGWCSHLMEEILNGGRIIRPAYKSVTPKKPYTPLNER